MKVSKSLKEVWAWKEKASKNKTLNDIFKELKAAELKRKQADKTNKDQQYNKFTY